MFDCHRAGTGPTSVWPFRHKPVSSLTRRRVAPVLRLPAAGMNMEIASRSNSGRRSGNRSAEQAVGARASPPQRVRRGALRGAPTRRVVWQWWARFADAPPAARFETAGYTFRGRPGTLHPSRHTLGMVCQRALHLVVPQPMTLPRRHMNITLSNRRKETSRGVPACGAGSRPSHTFCRADLRGRDMIFRGPALSAAALKPCYLCHLTKGVSRGDGTAVLHASSEGGIRLGIRDEAS